MKVVLNNLKLSNKPSTKEKKLHRTNRLKDYYDTEIPDVYYVELVNDCIWMLNHNQITYCFSLAQVIDILRYVPNIEISYIRDCNCFCMFKSADKS